MRATGAQRPHPVLFGKRSSCCVCLGHPYIQKDHSSPRWLQSVCDNQLASDTKAVVKVLQLLVRRRREPGPTVTEKMLARSDSLL